MRGDIRIGLVSSTDAKAHTARVTFSDVPDEEVVTFDLNLLLTRKGDYSLPDANDTVLCLLLDGLLGAGFVLGVIYTEADAPPTDQAARRVLAGDDVRLGAFDAGDKAAKAPVCKGNFDDLKTHFAVIEAVITGPAIPEPGNGSPSAFQTALAAAINGSAYPTPNDPACDNVRVK